MVVLRISERPNRWREVRLEAGRTYVVGRAAECDVRLDDETISRRHMTITVDGGEGVSIADADSCGGVSVDGRRFAETRVEPGQEIRTGWVTMAIARR